MKKFDPKTIFSDGIERNITTFLRLLDPNEIIDLFTVVDQKYYPHIMAHLDTHDLAQILPDLNRHVVSIVYETLPDDKFIEILTHLQTDKAAKLLRLLPEDKIEAILLKLPHSQEIETILSFPEDSAGHLMHTKICTLKEGLTVREAIEHIRNFKKEVGKVDRPYIVDEEGKLKGYINLDDLILCDPQDDLSKILSPAKHVATPEMDQEDVIPIFSKNDLSFLPVVNKDGKLLGHLSYDDIYEVVEEEASEDAYVNVGVPTDELKKEQDKNRIQLALGRLPWVIWSICASTVTAFLMTKFDKSVANSILFASFVPLIMSTTGNVGTQSAMIITRSFAHGKNEFGRFDLPLFREFSIGMILSLLSGSLAFIFVGVIHQKLDLSVKVALTMIISMTTATSLGILLPIVFKKLKIDPAIASGPLVTSSCDIISVSLYLTVILTLHRFGFPS